MQLGGNSPEYMGVGYGTVRGLTDPWGTGKWEGEFAGMLRNPNGYCGVVPPARRT